MVCFGTTVLISLVAASGLLFIRAESSPYDTRQVIDINPVEKARTSEDGLEYYQQTYLASFAEKHRKELKLAKKDRKRECGTIVSVSKIDCKICVLFVDGIKDLVAKGSTQDDVARFSTKACIDLQIEDERVCKAIIQECKVRSVFSGYMFFNQCW